MEGKITMRITKKGRAPSEMIWTGKCQVCNTEFEADGHEIKHQETNFHEGGAFSWEVCEYCGAGDKSTGFGGVLLYPKTDTPPSPPPNRTRGRESDGNQA